jgi:hypothetical protein
LHGVEYGNDWVRLVGERTGTILPRIRLETDRDLQAFSVPMNEGDAVSYQVQWRLFERWSEERAVRLLHPLAFLEWLHERVRDLQAAAQDSLVVDRVATVLETTPAVVLGFHWRAADGLPIAQALSVIPHEWHAALRPAVEKCGCPPVKTPDEAAIPPGRVFLVRYRTEVSEDLMLRAADE